MPQVTWSPAANDDVAEILSELSRMSLAAAARVEADIDNAARLLARFPGLGRPRPELGPDLHSRPTRTGHILFFYIAPDGIIVGRVFHGSRHVDPSHFEG